METSTQKIPLDIIDEPNLAMRTDVEDESIEELMADIKEVGLIEPIVVRPMGDRYEIIAGHRRTTAIRRLGHALIEAKIIDANDHEALRMRAIENLSRRDVDPVDEALYVADIQEQQKLSDEDVAKLLHRSIGWVQQRLEVFRMPTYLQEHLKYKRVTLGAALELSQIQNEDDRKYYSNYAAQNGVSIAQAKRWRSELNSRPSFEGEVNTEVMEEWNETPPAEKVVQCAACGGDVPLIEAETVWVHKRCPSYDTQGGN